MSSKIFKEDAASLALFYSYIGNKGRILKEEIVDQFDMTVDSNLEILRSKSYVYPLDYSKLPFFKATDNENTLYYVLKENFNNETFMNDYFYWLPKDVIKASQNENALSILGLTLVDGKIEKFEKGIAKELIKSKLG